MKFSELWLQEWVNPTLTQEELCAKLTMAGLEVDDLAPVAEQFSGIVVGKILSFEQHPDADRLNVCQVDIGKTTLSIVCGAKNVKPGMKIPAALDGAVLPNKTKITSSNLRGVTSHGMLCSAVELGLSEQGEGLLQLPYDAPIGANIWEYLRLTDFIMDVAITPNRGDCLSIMGMAKEVAALTESALHIPNLLPVQSSIEDSLSVHIQKPIECPRYVGRIIRGIQADQVTPMWIQERLRRGGVRCISPVVDVMNYVMLELGQPMHAFDLSKISQEINVRFALPEESLNLLDGQTVALTEETLVIADKEKPLAIAGVMGGLDSSVTLLTQDIFLESAFFSAPYIAKMGRIYHLSSESSYRFERGIDPTIQALAIERATELLLEIVGGKAGPLIEVVHTDHLPQPSVIHLRRARISQILGLTLKDQEIESIMRRLGFAVQSASDGWQVTVPARRSDITLEVDLIEEVIRLHGYDNLPLHQSISSMQMHARPEDKVYLSTLRRALCDLGFNEVVTYSFIDKKWQSLFDPEHQAKELMNPITAEMAVMRTNLWPGLITTLLYNQNRQQSRVRLFETGLRFILEEDGALLQQSVLSGVITGPSFPQQWGIPNREADFFDLKGDLQNIFKLTRAMDEFTFEASQHPALHPGQTASICRNRKQVGLMGALHPSIKKELDITGNVFVFEILLDGLEPARLARFSEVSKFPEISRDLALLVKQTVPAQAIQDTIINIAGELLKTLNVFDVYQGKGITPDCKSIALSLTLQHASRTLRDEEVADLMERIIVALKDQFAAELRS